jgi:hypothetical protein
MGQVQMQQIQQEKIRQVFFVSAVMSAKNAKNL